MIDLTDSFPEGVKIITVTITVTDAMMETNSILAQPVFDRLGHFLSRFI